MTLPRISITAALPRLVLAFAVAVSLTSPAVAPAATRTKLAAAAVAERLLAGRPVVLSDVVVTGELVLPAGRVIRGPFKCRRCTFFEEVAAADAEFTRTVDLRGSTFLRGIDFRSATFHGPAVFSTSAGKRGDGQHPILFDRHAEFGLAVFDDVASFDGAQFDGPASFADARFADVTFGRAEFAGAEFARTVFRAGASFRDARFEEAASFEQADFRSRTAFVNVEFSAGVSFARAEFAEGASFLAARFEADDPVWRPEDQAAVFTEVVSDGTLDFTFARFRAFSPKSTRVATFDYLVCAGSLLLGDARFSDGDTVGMAQIQVADLTLDVAVVRRVYGRYYEQATLRDRRSILEAVEASSKRRDDVGTANDAHYAIRVLRGDRYAEPWHALDYVFYRGVAGYFVRPLRPLLVFLAGVLLIAALRFSSLESVEVGTKSVESRARGWAGRRQRSATFATCLLDAFALAVPRWRPVREGPAPLDERIEVIVLRVLAVCVVIGLANSNPTLREMVDALV